MFIDFITEVSDIIADNFDHLKVSRSRNKIVMPKLLPKNKRMNLFLYPEK